MVKTLKLLNLKMLCFWKMKLSMRTKPNDPSNGAATPIRENGVTQEAIHEGNEKIQTIKVPLRIS